MTRSSQPRRAQIAGLPVSLSGTPFPHPCDGGVGLRYWVVLESEELQKKGTQQLGSGLPVCPPALPGPPYLLLLEGKALRVSLKRKCSQAPAFAAPLPRGVSAVAGQRVPREAEKAEGGCEKRPRPNLPKEPLCLGGQRPSAGQGGRAVSENVSEIRYRRPLGGRMV